jgi:hypothetical protein
MKNEEFIAKILEPKRSDKGKAKYRAYPSRRSVRWILPTTGVHRRSGMAVFNPSSVKGRALKSLISLGLLRGEVAPGAAEPLDLIGQFVSKGVERNDLFLSVSVGQRGAYQKHTLRVMTPNGTAIAYAKLADVGLAKEKIAAEHANLAYLAGFDDLNAYVPRILRFGEVEGWLVLVTSAGPDGPGPFGFSNDHQRFLRRLFVDSRLEKPLFGSTLWTTISSTLIWLSTRAPQVWMDRFNRTIALVRKEFGDLPIALSMVHRDFTPWNTRQMSTGLFIFDWEAGILEAPPLLDLIHFHAIQHVLLGRRFGIHDQAIIDAASTIVGSKMMRAMDIDSLYLVYLLDVACYYLRARLEAPNAGNSLVLTWAEHELDTELERRCG